METQHLLENAAKKLKRKNADYIIANSLITEGAGFGVDTNHVHLIDEHGSCEYKGSKKEISLAIFKSIFSTA